MTLIESSLSKLMSRNLSYSAILGEMTFKRSGLLNHRVAILPSLVSCKSLRLSKVSGSGGELDITYFSSPSRFIS